MMKIVNFKKGIILILFFAAIAAGLIVWQSRLGGLNHSALKVQRLELRKD